MILQQNKLFKNAPAVKDNEKTRVAKKRIIIIIFYDHMIYTTQIPSDQKLRIANYANNELHLSIKIFDVYVVSCTSIYPRGKFFEK